MAVALVSAAQLAFELALMRIFAVTQWHHFSYMVISIAMLGNAAAGTLLAIFTLGSQHRMKGLRIAAAGFALSVPLSYIGSQYIAFETFHLSSHPSQLLLLLALYLVLSLPFLFSASAVTLALLACPARLGVVYGLGMIGAGLGAPLATLLLLWISPCWLPACLAPLALAGAWICMGTSVRMRVKVGLIILVSAVSLWSLVTPPRISQYKGLAYARLWPDFRQIATARSPMSEVTAVASRMIRETPGQLSGYPMSELGPLPEQVGLFFDAGGMSVVNRFDGDLGPFTYLDYVTAALPYHVVETPRVAVIGAGGGTDVLMGLAHGAPQVTALEIDPSVYPLIARHLFAFSGGLYQRPEVRAVRAEARHYLHATTNRFNLIHLSLVDSFATSSAGVYALSENYIYTREAFVLYLQRLTGRGVLSVTRWIKTPARDAIKLFATAVEALEAFGISNPQDHLLWIRSWNTATVVVSVTPLTARQLASARDFCTRRGFDVCYASGLRATEANIHTILPEPVYFLAAQQLLGQEREAYYRRFLFNIRPATDDSPYFSRFFKWSALQRLLAGMGTEWIPFVEWGYLALLATLLQGALAALVCIFVPLVVFWRKGLSGLRVPTAMAYFGGVGMAYMLVEIAFIQKITLFLADPIYAVAVVLLCFLVGSGLGSVWSGHRRCRQTPSMLLLVVLLLGTALALHKAAPLLMGASAALRWSVAILAPAPLAFLMGVPFPSGLSAVGRNHRDFVPWAWGVNGVLSVMGAPVAMLIAMHVGLLSLVGAGACLYLLAAALFHRLSG